MSEFQRIGRQVPFGETAVGHADVEPIKEVAAGILLLARELGTCALSHDGTMSFIRFFNSNEDYNGTNRYVAVRMKWGDDLDFWRVAISFRSFVDADRHSSKRIRYQIEGFDEELLQAKKEVWLVRGLSEMSLVDGILTEEVTTDRKLYERPMVQQDCRRVTEMLILTRERAQAA